MKNLAPGPARDQFKVQLIGSSHYDQAAALSTSLDDPALRIRQMKLVKSRWDEGSPSDAKTWFEKLPQEDQDAIERKME